MHSNAAGGRGCLIASATRAGGFGFAHRLNTAFPLAVYGSYGNGGGYEQVGRLGMTVEF